MSQSKNITPHHPVKRFSIASDGMSPTGFGKVSKGVPPQRTISGHKLSHTDSRGGKVAGGGKDRCSGGNGNYE